MIKMLTTIITIILLLFIPIPPCDIIHEYNITIQANKSEISTTATYSPFYHCFDNLSTSIVRSNRTDRWDCVDYSIEFNQNNPEWGIVTISQNPRFQGRSHMINYYFYDNETMIVYDGLLDNMYHISNWQWDCRDYYHFWLDGSQPVRNYRYLLDNRNEVYTKVIQ